MKNFWCSCLILSCSLLPFLSMTIVVTGQEPNRAVQLVGEGIIVAFQKQHRCSSCDPNRTPGPDAEHAEYWVVRIDNWIGDATRPGGYILVKYDIHGFGLSDREINRRALRFQLRERREGEAVDCRGAVIGSEPYSKRPSVLSDYEYTRPGSLQTIPPLETLPCFVSEDRPTPVKRVPAS